MTRQPKKQKQNKTKCTRAMIVIHIPITEDVGTTAEYITRMLERI